MTLCHFFNILTINCSSNKFTTTNIYILNSFHSGYCLKKQYFFKSQKKKKKILTNRVYNPVNKQERQE